ncbi:uncharacterized protein LOC126054007 [Helicoverpa armigera]|uniref:uncharacterized protein LOC126054007 n=1 Tax=Helicoverpa armigera TaxID=29058 RepID=UPI003083A092
MLILSLFLLQALSSLDCYDPDSDGAMKVGLHSYGKGFNPTRKLLSINFISQEKDSNMKALEDPEVLQVLKEAQLARQKPNSEQQVIKDLIRKANRILENMGTQILTDLNIKKNITSILEVVTDDLAMMMQKYYDVINSDRINSIDDKYSIYVDLVDTSGRLLYSEGRAMVEEIISDKNMTSQNKSIELLNEKIFKMSVEGKKEGMKHVCEVYNICKECPMFTDYAANLLSEIIKLSDDKFRKFVDILVSISKNCEDFFASVIEKEDREFIINELQPLLKDSVALRVYFVTARDVMEQNFNGDLKAEEEKLNIKAKAIRILLEIINKALSSEEDLLTIDLELSLSALKDMNDEEDKVISRIWEVFLKKIIKILNHNLSRTARTEMSVLIKAITREVADDDNLVIDVLMRGSRYVEDEQLPLDMGVFV